MPSMSDITYRQHQIVIEPTGICCPFFNRKRSLVWLFLSSRPMFHLLRGLSKTCFASCTDTTYPTTTTAITIYSSQLLRDQASSFPVNHKLSSFPINHKCHHCRSSSYLPHRRYQSHNYSNRHHYYASVSHVRSAPNAMAIRVYAGHFDHQQTSYHRHR